jgi:hypothetical protein
MLTTNEQGGHKRRRSSLVWGLLLSLAGVVIALIIAEVFLRSMGPSVDPYASNPWLGCVGWAGRPHQQITWVTDEFVTTEVINSAGLPDVEHSYRKPPGVFRILIVGDSFVESWQVKLGDSFPRLLEQLLNENRSPDSPRFEVIKVGYRGWATVQELLYWHCEGHRYSPDLVLLAFTANDIVDNNLNLRSQNVPPSPYYTLDGGELALQNFPYPPPPPEAQPKNLPEFLYKHFVIYRIAKKGWETASLRLEEAQTSQASAEQEEEPTRNEYPVLRVLLPVYSESYPAEYEQGWQLTVALVHQMHEEVSEKGAAFAVFSTAQPWVSYPVAEEVFKEEASELQGGGYDFGKPDRLLGGLLQEIGVPFLSMDPLFKIEAADQSEPWFFFREGHYSERGHRFVAGLLYEWLVGQELVPLEQK